MSRLPRPHVPVETQCRVLLRQLGEMWPDKVVDEWRYSSKNKARSLSLLRGRLMGRMAEQLGCEPGELWLDHDPALENREKVYRRGVHVDYRPAANDPEHLFFRPQGAQHAGSHYVKTNVRGDRGQLSDNGLRRKQKKMDRNRAPSQKGKSRFIAKTMASKPISVFEAALGPKRDFKMPSRWPPKGSRKIKNRR